ncbi:PQQ-dependent sugar dehydrogenase, partial [Alphaproteobacteria bacterium]|nr:PQQ-dependent sugar dehydrogenase [Alphaproteobacteria bacterium]
ILIILIIIILAINLSRGFRENERSEICFSYVPFFVNIWSKLINSTAVNGEDFCKHLYNDYNVKFLPETQVANFEFKIINLDNNFKYNRFAIELYEDKLFLINMFGVIKYSHNKLQSAYDLNTFDFNNVDTNVLDFIKNGRVLDSFLLDKKFYISYYFGEECQQLGVASADINTEILVFEPLITFEECHSQTSTIGAGRIQSYSMEEEKGLLFTTSMNNKNDKKANNKAQDDKSIFGKILFINLESKKYKIFAKGFRNPQGLFVKNDLILTSEHGPRGGDEINKIVLNQNYGWPISSYGEPYGVGYRDRNDDYLIKNFYEKNHFKFGFVEPLYSFVPSIGPSELIEVPNSFHPKWQNNFLLSSLSGHSLFRLKFDNNFDKILFSEKIYIGYRVRDLKYDSLNNVLLLAMENFGQIGVLIPETNKISK